MVNLAFCKLDVTYLISLAIPKHNIHLFPFRIPSAGRSFMLEFLGWSFKYHLVWCFPNCFGLFGHLLFGFRFPGEIVICWPEGNQRKRWWAWIMIPICWMLLVSWWIFSNNRRRLFRSRPMNHFKLFKVFWSIRQILFTSVPLYYFDLKSDWLPFETVAFGSPPEDLLMLYLLFVPIE